MQKQLKKLKNRALQIFKNFNDLVPKLKNLQNDYFSKEQNIIQKIEKIKLDRKSYMDEIQKIQSIKNPDQTRTQDLLKFKNDYLVQLEELNVQLDELKKANFNYLQDFKELDNEIKKLQNSEYVLAVVGTMKAGKSTVINAIIGSEILPNRADPMTVLPTLITHNPDNLEPKLFLPKSKLLNEIKNEIKLKISLQSFDTNLNTFLKSKPGKELMRQIENGFIFKNEYSKDELINALTIFNDLMRLSIKAGLNEYINEFKDIDELPRIEVNFSSLDDQLALNDSKFSLLDTPGANEAFLFKELEEIFKTQLKRASGIALIIDSTNIGSKSSSEIQDEFKKVSSYIGQNDSFILANKFDLRSYKDGDSAQMKEDIKNDFEIEDKNFIKNHIFAISAKNAFYANLGLNELKKFGQIKLQEDELKIFGETLFGRRWKSEISDLDLVKKECLEVLKESNFDLAINSVITNTYKNSYIKTILNPINKLELIICSPNLPSKVSILQKLELNMNFYSKTNDELRKDIKELETKIEIINSNINWIKSEILDKNSLENVFTYLKKISEDELKKSSDEFIEKFKVLKKDDVKYAKFLNSQKIQEFESMESAKEFLKPIIDSLNSELEDRIFNYEIICTSQIEKFCKDFNDALKEKLEKILNETNENITKEQKILDLQNFEIHLNKKRVDNFNIFSIKSINQKESGAIGIAKRKIGTYINPLYKNSWGFKQVNLHTLTLNDLQDRIHKVIHNELSLINNQMLIKKTHILQQMETSLKDINTKVTNCLEDMQSALKQKTDQSFDSFKKLENLEELKRDFLIILDEIRIIKDNLSN